MPMHDDSAVYLRRADEARAQATLASSFVVMDELLDIADAWRALAAEARRLAQPAPATPIAAVRRARAKNIRLVPLEREKTDAA